MGEGDQTTGGQGTEGGTGGTGGVGGGDVPVAPGEPAPGMQRGARPTGVTILAVLEFIGGLALLGVGGMFMAAGPVLIPADVPGAGAIFAALGGFIVLIGLLYFLVGWGLWTGRAWAWTAALVLAIIGLLGFPIGTIISVIILYYLTRPGVKRYFGKAPAAA